MRPAISFLLTLLLLLAGTTAIAQTTDYAWLYKSSGSWVLAGGTYSTDPSSANVAVTKRLSTTGWNCSSWNFDYNDPANGNYPGPVVQRYTNGNGNFLMYPVMAHGCAVVADRTLAPSDAVAQVVCDTGYLAVVGGGTVSCVLSASPPSNAQMNAGIPIEASLTSDLGCSECELAARGYVGDPIHLATGNVLEIERDFVGVGGNRLEFVRYYNSLPGVAATAFMGAGWRHSYSHRALVKDQSYALLVRPDGRTVRFDFDGATFSGPASEHGTFSRVPAVGTLTGWRYVDAAGNAENYSPAGLLQSIVYKQGGGVSLAYNGFSAVSEVSDGLGRTMTFNYTNGFLTSVKASSGQVLVTLAYDGYSTVASATYPDGSARKYTYEQRQSNGQSWPLLTSIVDGSGIPAALFTYDGQGRAVSSSNAGGTRSYSLSYAGGSTTVTRNGAAETHSFDTSSGKPQAGLVTVQCPTGCAEAGQRSATYNAGGQMTSSVDKAGVLTCTVYDDVRGLPLQVIEGLAAGTNTCGGGVPSYARVTSYAWHPTLEVLTGIASPLLVVTQQLDAAGRVVAYTEQATTDVNGSAGFQASPVGAARTTNMTYDSRGYVTSVRRPRTDVLATTTYAYDSAQNLTSITDPVGLVTAFGGYDWSGRPGSMTAPNGLQTTMAYDPLGRVSQLNVGGAITSYSYTTAGRLASVGLPSGLSLTYSYDGAGRLVQVKDSAGNQTSYVLDAQGNVIQTTVTGGGALAYSRQMAYDALSRLTAITKAQ